MNTSDARLQRPQSHDEHTRAERAEHAAGVNLARLGASDALRAAKQQRRVTIRAYANAADALSPTQQAAVRAYTRALSGEAAANRALARTLTEQLISHGESSGS